MKNIKGISVVLVAKMSNHIANGGEKLLGNASSIKRRPDGKVYISGQMQRQALFRAIERINLASDDKADTYVSNGDGITNQIEKDLRADMGGWMHPSGGNYSGRRTSPISANFAVAIAESDIGRDLLVRLKQNADGVSEGQQKQALATREFSQADEMQMAFHLDVSALSISKRFKYDAEKHVETELVKHATEDERMRRAKLYLEASRSITDYANQARNATTAEPCKVFIVLDAKLSRKCARYFEMTETEQKNLLEELEDRNAAYFIGDDESETSVYKAYKQAFNALESLYDPTNNATPISFAASLNA